METVRHPITFEPHRTRRLEKGMGPVDIGIDECVGSFDRSIDVTFRREVDDHAQLVFAQEFLDQRSVTDVPVDEGEPGFTIDRREAGAISRVGQGVKHHHPLGRILPQPPLDAVRPDETRSTRYQHSTHCNTLAPEMLTDSERLRAPSLSILVASSSSDSALSTAA